MKEPGVLASQYCNTSQARYEKSSKVINEEVVPSGLEERHRAN